MRSVLIAPLTGALTTFLLCGLLVSWSFAVAYWYVFVLGAAVGGLVQWLIRRQKQTPSRAD